MAGFTVPNKAITFPFQSRVYEADWIISTRAAGGQYGVLFGDCEVTEAAVPDMSVDVDAGLVVVAGSQVSVAGGSVPIEDADALLPRWDLIIAEDDGSVAAVTGVADAAPVPVNPGDTQVGLAFVFVPALATTVTDTNIVDKRVWVRSPLEASEWIMLPTGADVTRSNTATFAADPGMAFAVSASGKYRVRGQARFIQSAASFSSGLKWGFSGPAAPTYFGGLQATFGPSTSGAWQRIIPATYNAGVASITGIGGGTDFGFDITFEVLFRNGASTGTFALIWAQNQATASPTLTRLAESYMEYQVV